MNVEFLQVGLPISDLIVGASLYFPPIFKAFLLGMLLWGVIHRLLRNWMYSGEVWHPTLMDLSLFVLSVFVALILIMRLT
ncbi:DUF1656 domain-containing protein [Vibrio sp. CK2-1]|uniref:DUF1656 domain-containing protein n=1 Tax=Vibrio sp. CK2-1 TaxID=2912249 RepID=UPI001F30165B|nr:DUF1656 domain-containing protein [Vibrio sp. CK2-1]MCF7353592.1 DUF1656 domain-containing protein [Vibrio sp. CK2-1]